MLRPHKHEPLNNGKIVVKIDCCNQCPIPVEATLSGDVTVDNSDIITELQNQINLQQQLLTELQNQPQIEGIQLTSVCYNDNTSGYVGMTLDEEAGVYTPVYFDDQRNLVTGKVVIPCPEGSNVELGPPIEVCI